MHRRTLAVATTAASLALLLVTPVTSRAATAQVSQANAALRYLYSQVGSNGSVASSAGATEDTVISVADNGYDAATLEDSSSGSTSYSYLAAQRAGVTTAGSAAKMVLAWLAAGRPAAFDSQSLLDKLNAPTSTGGFLTTQGTFHNNNPAVESANAYSQALGVLADAAAHGAGVACGGSVGPCPLPANATGWLLCAQRSTAPNSPDGGFGYTIIDSTPTPPSFCGDTSSDTNDSGIVLQALGLAHVNSADSAAETYLRSAQNNDGGFGFSPGSGSDPDSDTTVIQALLAIGQDPTAAAWSKGGASAVSNLETFAGPNGGYTFPGHSSPDAFTTSPVPQALALKPYGAANPAAPAGSTPPRAATPTPSATPAPSAVPVPATGVQPASSTGPGAALLLAAGLLALGSLWALRRRQPLPRRAP